MAGSTAQVTVQAIADSIGLRLTEPSLISIVEQSGQSYIEHFLEDAATFFHSSRSPLLTTSHVDMVFESRKWPPLLGYCSPPVYSPQLIPVDQCDLLPPREPPRSLLDAVTHQLPVFPPLAEHYPRWRLIEGVSPIGKSSHRRRDTVKPPRPIDRTVSVPTIAGALHSDPPPSQSLALHLDRPPETRKVADDVLSASLQRYFVTTVNLLRFDAVHSYDGTLDLLSQEDRLQILVPYFLQFVFGRICIGLHRPGDVCACIGLALAIVNDRFVAVPLFAHAFLKVALTGLLALGFDYDDDTSIRRLAGKLLRVVCDRCATGFPEIRPLIFNALVAALFAPETALTVHLGALIGLRELGEEQMIIEHLPAYVGAVRGEVRAANSRQSILAVRVLAEVQEIATIATGSNDVRERILRMIADADSLG